MKLVIVDKVCFARMNILYMLAEVVLSVGESYAGCMVDGGAAREQRLGTSEGPAASSNERHSIINSSVFVAPHARLVSHRTKIVLNRMTVANGHLLIGLHIFTLP
jgi:hypothetical protein